MTTLTIRTNAGVSDPVLVRDLGIYIPADHTTPGTTDVETFYDSQNIDRCMLSSDLRALCTDDAYGAGSSTLILNDGTSDVPQALVEQYLDGPHAMQADGQIDPDVIPPTAGYNRGFSTQNGGKPYTECALVTWQAVAAWSFPGTGNPPDPLLVPDKCLVTAASALAGDIEVRVYDADNALTLCSAVLAATPTPATFDLGTVSNLPETRANLELQGRKVGQKAWVYFVNLYKSI